MRQVVRFWMLILSVTVGFVSFTYLFLSFASFISPEVPLVTTGTEERLAVMGVALVSLAVFIWAFVFAGGPGPESVPQEGDESKGPTLGNRNR